MGQGQKERMKMCPFCEGSISLDAAVCKFCGSSVLESQREKSVYQQEESLSSLYDPPYSPHKSKRVGVSPSGEIGEERSSIRPERKIFETASKNSSAPEEKEEGEEGKKLGALLLLSIGGQLFTLAWLLFFFSDHGRVVLEWKSRFWPLYLLLSIPLLYQGWRKVNHS